MHQPPDRPARDARGRPARRRALYGPPPRLTRTSPLVGRLLWHIGDWGRASEHIGARWERVAGDLLRERLGPDSSLIVLGARPALLAEILGSGLPHADALRGWRRDGRLALEPLDFKWSLETAAARQVSGETLSRLLDLGLPQLQAELAAARAALGLPGHARPQPIDGRFLAPEHAANRAARRADPALASVLLPVDGQAFFAPLPAWPAARALARLEGHDLERQRGVEAVERSYRLGAGVAGALARLRGGLFADEPATLDTGAAIAALRDARGRAGALNALLLDLEQQLAARRALEEQLAALLRAAYPFGRLRLDLARAGAPRGLLESRGALGRAHGEVLRALAGALRAAGRAQVAAGLGEAEALQQLAARTERWTALGEQQARALARRARGG